VTLKNLDARYWTIIHLDGAFGGQNDVGKSVEYIYVYL